MKGRPIYIRAAGVVSAAGIGIPALQRAVADPDWKPNLGIERPDGPPLAVATCIDFSTKGHISPLIARRLERPAKLLAVAAHETLLALGDPLPWDRSRIGLTAGTSNASTAAVIELLRFVFLANPDEAPPAQFPSAITNAAASQVGIIDKLGGPNLTFVEKQIGGIRAVVEAARLFDRSRADAVLACGVDETMWINAEGYRRLGTLRHRRGGVGQILSEGAISIMIAPEPGSAPLARLVGWASASSPTSPWCYPDQADGLTWACNKALAMAGLAPSDIDAICTLANGIVALDSLEHLMVRSVFADHRPAVINVTPLGEGAFAGTLRILAAALASAGLIEPCWPVPAHLASLHLPALTHRPRHVLVPGLAGGGSAIAVVVSGI